MPDVHAGKGCVIGFTANLKDRIIPNVVGVDIGCGMLCVELKKMPLDFMKLDTIIKTYIPSGYQVHEGRIKRFPMLQDLNCYRSLQNTKRLERSLGTLGGGNHFIEIDGDQNGDRYLVIHTGSRNLGKQVAEHYQNLAYDIMQGKEKLFEKQQQLIQEYKTTGRKSEIQHALQALKNSYVVKETDLPKDLCYLEGTYCDNYLHDMYICQEYAQSNRNLIASIILEQLFHKPLESFSSFETVHNYIDPDDHIIRKGAVSAKKGEKLLVPINMRDGSLICIGKGNKDWNYSAPHGAGRLYSRTKAKELFTIEEFKNSM